MDHTRHIGIFQIPSYFNVAIIGAGGLGAMTALMFAKMGVRNMSIFDDDEVSEINLPTQLHRVSDIGKSKLFGLEQTLNTYADELNLDLREERFEFNTYLPLKYDLIVSCVDSITARHGIWGRVSHLAGGAPDFYLDMRMAAEQFQHFLVNMFDKEAVLRYSEMLFSINESDIPDVPCTEKATFYCAAIAAGHAGAVLRNIVRGEASSQRLIHYIPQAQILNLNL